MWGNIISGAALVLVAVIEALSARERKRAKEDRAKAEKRYNRRQELEKLEMEVTLAQSETLDVICIAVSGGHINGNVEAARNRLRDATDKYHQFIMTAAAGTVTKV